MQSKYLQYKVLNNESRCIKNKLELNPHRATVIVFINTGVQK